MHKNRKPKVMLITWLMAHYRENIYKRLANNSDMEFIICTGSNPSIGTGNVATLSPEGLNVIEVKSKRFFKYFEWQPGAIKAVLKERPDVVVLVSIYCPSNWIIRILCRMLGIKIIDWTIGVMGFENPIKWFFRKLHYKLNNAFLFYGQWARDRFVNSGFKAESAFIIRNSLDYEKQVAIRSTVTEEEIKKVRLEFGVERPDSRLLFHSGRIELKKKLNILFDALQLFKERGRHFKLILVGKGGEEDKLKAYVQKKGLSENVIFYGACYDENRLGQMIMASDLVVTPGVTGLIAMHSMVYGTPILTRYNDAYEHGPEVEAVVEGVTGGYFRDGDIEDVVEKMEYLLYENPCKPRMAKACMDVIDNVFNPGYQEKVFMQAINYVLKGKTKK
jgi:glycosyltransferase involved in cell wall biosynthesis